MAKNVSIKVYRGMSGAVNPYEVYYNCSLLNHQNVINGDVEIEKNGSYYDLYIDGNYQGGRKTLKATAEYIEEYIEKEQAKKDAFTEITNEADIKELESLKDWHIYVTDEERKAIVDLLEQMRKGKVTEGNKNISKIYASDHQTTFYIEHKNMRYSEWWLDMENPNNLARGYILNKLSEQYNLTPFQQKYYNFNSPKRVVINWEQYDKEIKNK